MPKAELTEVTLQLVHETLRAYLFTDDGEEKSAKWVPKSQVEVEFKRQPSIFEVTMPIWLAQKNGWI